MTIMNKEKIWLVTGASQGLGLTLVKTLLTRGFRVAALSRSADVLQKAMGTDGDNERFLPVQSRITDEDSTRAAIEKVIHQFGRIDVVVNNAGYGLGGSVEELTDRETRENFEVNVFGTLNIIRKVMPYLRAQRSGHIFNISSIAGFTSINGAFSIYSATKFAICGMSEALATDVKPFGIKVTIVAPGAFRTNFLTPESLVLAQNPIGAYEHIRATHLQFQQWNGQQPGDPEKAATAMIQMAGEAEPALYLFLGKDAYRRATLKNEAVQSELTKWEALITGTDF